MWAHSFCSVVFVNPTEVVQQAAQTKTVGVYRICHTFHPCQMYDVSSVSASTDVKVIITPVETVDLREYLWELYGKFFHQNGSFVNNL